jgi:hypothetical protein
MTPYRRSKITILVHKNAVKTQTTHSIGIISAKQTNAGTGDEINLEFSFICGLCDWFAKAFQIIPGHALSLAAKWRYVRKKRVGGPASNRRPYDVVDRGNRLASPSMRHKASPPLRPVMEWHERGARLIGKTDLLNRHPIFTS